MKNICRLIFIVTFFGVSFVAQSSDMNPMKEMMKQQIMDTCNDEAFLSCIGINKKKCVSSVEKAVSSCDHLFPKDMTAMDDTTMNAHGDCLSKSLMENSGVSSSKLDACDAIANNDAPPMEPQEAMAMMGQALQAHAAAVGTDGVTLPLYKNATLMSHFANGEMGQLFDDVEQLPALVMSSPDNVDKIVGYYRKKLKGFNEYKIDGGILFMENGPKDFDILKHMRAYVSTPHVAIIEDDGGAQGAKSRIEIAYKKK